MGVEWWVTFLLEKLGIRDDRPLTEDGKIGFDHPLQYVEPLTAHQWVQLMSAATGGFYSKDRKTEKASNRELWRWLERGSVEINGVKPGPKEVISRPITSFVMFPGNDRARVTIR